MTDVGFTHQVLSKRERVANMMEGLAARMAGENFVELLLEYPQYIDDILEEFKRQNESTLEVIFYTIREDGCLFHENHNPVNAEEMALIMYMIGVNENEVFVERRPFLERLARTLPKVADYLKSQYVQDLAPAHLATLMA